MRDDPIYTEEYKGFTVKIYHDSESECPWKDWDAEPPLAVYSDGGITEYGKYGQVGHAPRLTKQQIIVNIRYILSVIGARNVREAMRMGQDYGDDLEDGINGVFSSHVDTLYASSRLYVLKEIYNMIGQPALVRNVYGPSQGYWALVLAVATPEFQKACGNAEGYWNDPTHLQASIQLFEDWAFGNVYGYAVEDADGEDVHSCWGFFGNYDGLYGALPEARSIADHEYEKLRAEKNAGKEQE